MSLHLHAAPFLPFWMLGVLAVAAAGLLGWSLVQRRAFWAWRAFGLLMLLGALLNPLLDLEQRSPIKDVVALVLDESASQSVDVRPAQMAAARAALQEKLKALPDVETRVITYDGQGDDGTYLFKAIRQGLKDVAPERMGGVILLTDGEVEDTPDLASFGLNAPVHVLLTGRENERDRRIEGVELPKFGIVGKDVTLKLRVDDTLANGEPGQLQIRREGHDLSALSAPVGRTIDVPVHIEHPGANIFEVQLAPVPGELTLANNHLVISIEGVRDRVRVLLVSGAPNPGERSWRNVLKSDPNIDLIHYTILRYPNRRDDTPVSELALISFPMEQLFSQDIEKFDLIIFDRYANQAPLPDYYFDNIANYVRRGGALLVSVGPDFADADGLAQSPLADILPFRAREQALVQPFRPTLTPLGLKHPLTRDLPDQTHWGLFYRQIAGEARGMTLMQGAQDQPLLVASHADKGRVAMILTDQLWLWARGVGGGGPHIDLLRRMTHWLLKEPALEEEALRATAKGMEVHIERQTLADKVADVHLVAPSGKARDVRLAEEKPGLWQAQVGVDEQGLYQLSDGTFQTFVNVGLLNPREFADVVSTPKRLAPLAEASGGSVRRLSGGSGAAIELPYLVRMSAGSHYAGRDYIGLRRNDLSTLSGLTSQPVGLGFLALIVLGGLFLLIWLREAFPNGLRQALARLRRRSDDM